MKIAKLIAKKLEGGLNKIEEAQFNQWLRSSSDNRKILENITALKRAGKDISVLKKLNSDAAWSHVLQKLEAMKNDSSRSRPFKSVFKYAAIFIGIIGLSSALWFNATNTNENDIVSDDVITLEMDNGQIKILSSDESQILEDRNGNVVGSQKGSALLYSDTFVVEELVYNTLKIPNGKRFEIKLSDGTHVHLNSGSSLRYPIKFISGAKRQVFLTGEAFFDVTEDSVNPFVVSSSGMDVKVLGTKFNVSAYPEDVDISTVLVKGSVAISKSDQPFEVAAALLKPGHLAAWNKGTDKIEIENVDTNIYTGWTTGKLVLKKIPFTHIVPKLERHYNVSIRNEYLDLERQVFTATYDVETIEEVLNSLQEDTPFEYKKIGDIIVIREHQQE